MGDTTIEWTEKTWNPTRGCSLVSPGCTNCYAMGQAHRFSGKGKPFDGLTKNREKLGVVWTGKVRLAPEMLAIPMSWKKPLRVFVNSMSDLFHEELANEEIAAVFGVMAASPRHTFQILTKRAKRMRKWFEWATPQKNIDALWPYQTSGFVPSCVPGLVWPLPNVWLGVSAEDQERADDRIPWLLDTPAAVRFVSYEPALGPIDFTSIDIIKQGGEKSLHPNDPLIRLNALTGHVRGPDDVLDTKIDWVIVGGESGPSARPFDVAWARSVVEQCHEAGVACFVKQLGAKPFAWDHVNKRADGRLDHDIVLKSRKGNDMAEWPAYLRARQFPRGAT